MDLKEGMYLRSTYGDIGKIRTHIQYWANKEEYDYVITDNDKSFDRYSISKTRHNISRDIQKIPRPLLFYLHIFRRSNSGFTA